MSKRAKIGFHAAYSGSSGFAKESGMANAIVGAYLNSLGLPNQAVAYMTMAAPNSMAWLTPEDAVALGLNVTVYDFDKKGQPQPPPMSQNSTPPAATQMVQATETTKRVQKCLSGFKFYRGSINGLLDDETSHSIKNFQTAWGMRVTGTATYELLSKCGINE